MRASLRVLVMIGTAPGVQRADRTSGSPRSVPQSSSRIMTSSERPPGDGSDHPSRRQRGVGQTLPGTVRRDEVLRRGQTLPVAGLDQPRDNLALRLATRPRIAAIWRSWSRLPRHPSRSSSTAGSPRPRALHLLPASPCSFRSDQLTRRSSRSETALVLLLDPLGLLLVTLEDLGACRRLDNVLHADSHTGPGGPVETGLLERVQRRREGDLRVALGEVVDDRRQLPLRIRG